MFVHHILFVCQCVSVMLVYVQHAIVLLFEYLIVQIVRVHGCICALLTSRAFVFAPRVHASAARAQRLLPD